MKYTNNQSLGRSGVGTAFPCVPTKKKHWFNQTTCVNNYHKGLVLFHVVVPWNQL